LATALSTIADGGQDLRARTEQAFLPPLKIALDGLATSLSAQPVTQASLPPEIVRNWVAPDGRARVSVAPKGDPSDNEQMRHFARSVLAIEPAAIEGPISVLEAGDTVVRAFIEAGLWAMLSIGLLLWIVLRRIGDVLLTLIPLILAGVVTLQLCVLIGMPLNFANIIALPLLLGVGVAFKIYYIMAWRDGQTNLLQTSLTRAVFYSALTTATAFGSLWFSSHPGTSSMGKLLALSLICTLAAAVLFQPVLMGKPREAVPATGPDEIPPEKFRETAEPVRYGEPASSIKPRDTTAATAPLEPVASTNSNEIAPLAAPGEPAAEFAEIIPADRLDRSGADDKSQSKAFPVQRRQVSSNRRAKVASNRKRKPQQFGE
jgi:hypothetical protein